MLKMINPKLSKMQVWFILFLGSYVTSILVPTAFAQAVDEDVVIYADGNLLTMNPDQPTASAMAVKQGKIIAVGDLSTCVFFLTEHQQQHI